MLPVGAGNQDTSSTILDLHPILFHLYTNNIIQNSYSRSSSVLGIFKYESELGDQASWASFSATTIIMALLTPTYTFGTTGSSWSCLGTPMNMNVIEHETAINVPGGIDTAAWRIMPYEHPSLIKTASVSGRPRKPARKAYNFAANQNPAVQQDVWTVSPPPMPVPHRARYWSCPIARLTANAIPGGSNALFTLPIWNSGTSAMNWTVTKTTANWLTCRPPAARRPSRGKQPSR